MKGLWNEQFLSQNSQRHYPLADDAGGRDLTGSFTLPNDVLVELDLPISAGTVVDPGRFYVRYVGAYATGYAVIVGYQPAAGDPVNVATALIPSRPFTRNTVYALGGVAPFDDTMGKLVVGSLDNIASQPPGLWEFSLEEGRLDPDAVRPMVRGVSALVCVTGGQRSAPLRGDVELVAGANMQLVPIVVAGQDPVIRFNAISGEGTVDACVCEGDAAPPPPIRTINGIPPASDQNFNLVGSDCVGVTAIANGARLTNTCSKPCCGCAELERITQDLMRFGEERAAVQEFVARLQESVNVMDLVVLGAKLSDRGCQTC